MPIAACPALLPMHQLWKELWRAAGQEGAQLSAPRLEFSSTGCDLGV